MTNPFVQSMSSNFAVALRLMEAALKDCPDDLWVEDLWREAPTGPTPHGGLHGSAPWFLGYHAFANARLRPYSRVRAVGTTTTI